MFPKTSYTEHTEMSLLGCGLLVLVVGLVVPAARGDQVHTAGQTFGDVTIRKFDGEFVIFSTADGRTVAKKLMDVTALFVDSVDRLNDFNQAERLYQQKEYRQAAVKYQKVLPRGRSFWKNLIRVRYVSACDREGALDKAVETYIVLAHTLPEKADLFMPTNIASAPTEMQSRALQLLEKALPKVSTQAAYWHLEALRLSILEATENEEAGTLAQKIIAKLQGKDGRKSRLRLQMIAIRIEVKHKQHQVALDHINHALSEAGDTYIPELLLLKGKCLYETAAKREDYLRAGLAFMRVVIHFPKSRCCAESMYWTGLVHEKISRIQKALELYQGCQELPGANDRIRQLAGDALQRLQSSG